MRRIGRVLVLWILARRLDVDLPPPVSVLIARDPGGYLAELYWFRIGEVDRWNNWFAGMVESAGLAAVEWAEEVEEVLGKWQEQLVDLRSDATARQVLGLLPAHPVVSARTVAEEVGVSERAARGHWRISPIEGSWSRTTGRLPDSDDLGSGGPQGQCSTSLRVWS